MFSLARSSGFAVYQLLLPALALGVAGGVGLFTFYYARGASYLSDDPQACRNCHVMNSVYESWLKGGHQHAATCNDCHVPHDFLGKWLTKAENGFHHSFAFTFYDIAPVIRARSRSQAVVQQNCQRCHADAAQHATGGASGQSEALPCKSCHSGIGHNHG